jgi:hypothetical protein
LAEMAEAESTGLQEGHQEDHEDRCDHCFSGHTHTLGSSAILPLPTYPKAHQHNIPHRLKHFDSAVPSGLYRPPRV